jgi:hypothetical protein
VHPSVSSPWCLRGPRRGASDSPAVLWRARRGGPVPARGPAGAAVMGAAARVTSRRGHTRQVVPGAAVRDASRNNSWRDPAADTGGDVSRRDKVAVAAELTVRAGEHPPGRPGHPLAAGRAGGRGASLIHQRDGDPGLPGLVCQDLDQVADAPVAGAPVLPPPRPQVQDAPRVADRDGADAVFGGPADDRLGGPAARRSTPAHSTTRPPRQPATRSAATAAPGSPAHRPGRCGIPPAANRAHGLWA